MGSVMTMDMNAFEELSRKLTLIEARLASYERLHAEEISELRSMLQELKMRQVALQSQAAHEAAQRLDERDGQAVKAGHAGSGQDSEELEDTSPMG